FSGFFPVGLKCQARAESALYQENLVPLVTANLPFLIRKVLDEPFSQEIPRPVVLQQRDQELLIVLPILRAEHRETARQPLQPRQRGCGGVLRVLLYVSHFDVLSGCDENLGDFALRGARPFKRGSWRGRGGNSLAPHWRTSMRKRQRGRFLRSGPRTTRPLALTFSTQSPLASSAT